MLIGSGVGPIAHLTQLRLIGHHRLRLRSFNGLVGLAGVLANAGVTFEK
jgi:hypothetical protein